MDCSQLPLILLEAVSWTQRFLTRKFEKKKVYLWQTNLKANLCRNSMFQVNRKKNASGGQRLTSSNQAVFFVCMFVCKSLFKHGKSSVNQLKIKPKYNCFTWLPCGNPIYQLPSWYFAWNAQRMQHLSFWESYSKTWPHCERSFVSNNWCLV